MEMILKRFESPDEERVFEKGRFQLITAGGVTIGRATYQPGWKWSVHVAPTAGKSLCDVEHVGLVLAGHAVAAFEDGTIIDLTAGSMFYTPPDLHDSWVVGDEESVSLHFQGAETYAQWNRPSSHRRLPSLVGECRRQNDVESPEHKPITIGCD